MYDSGRNKVRFHRSNLPCSLTPLQAQNLVADLSWLDTDFYERWRRIIFTSSSPVSWRWKALMRITFTVSFVVVAYLTWIALGGVYRAHRQRLVWGERLMSWLLIFIEVYIPCHFYLFPHLSPAFLYVSWAYSSLYHFRDVVDLFNIMYNIFYKQSRK